MRRPTVSVIIPAYRAEASLPGAVASVAACGLPEDAVEIVVASDDGQDYRPLLPRGPRYAFAPLGPVQSGAGPARNRALAQARGQYIAFLDADDSWEPDYLTFLLPLAQRHGAAFGRTAVIEDGAEILRLPPGPGDVLRLEDLGRTGASYHPVLARRLARAFTTHLSQDVRHAAELLARLGGSAPLGRAAYRLHLRGGSTTAEADFSARVGRAYDAHIAEIEAGSPGSAGLSPALRARLIEVFRDKARLNAAYSRDAAPGQSFYRFVAARLAAREGS